jgi:hypothetical protein
VLGDREGCSVPIPVKKKRVASHHGTLSLNRKQLTKPFASQASEKHSIDLLGQYPFNTGRTGFYEYPGFIILGNIGSSEEVECTVWKPAPLLEICEK